MSPRATGPLGNEATQNRLRNRDKKRDLMLNNAFEEWMSEPNGRLLFFWIVEGVCNANGTSFVLNGAQTAFNEGVRAVGIKIRDKAQELVPGYYVQALHEELQRRQEDYLHKETAEELEDADR